MKQHILVFGSMLAVVMTGIIACQANESKKTTAPAPILLKKDQPSDTSKTEEAQTPIIQLSDTTQPALNLLLVRDSASNSTRLSMKLAHIYTQQLIPSIQRNKLAIVGAPMAIYKNQQSPFFFEAGFPVDRMPQKKMKGILAKRINPSRAIVANFYGPYESTEQAYVDDPIGADGQPKDPYQVLTRIVMPYH
jgi:hypothetical protein